MLVLEEGGKSECPEEQAKNEHVKQKQPVQDRTLLGHNGGNTNLTGSSMLHIAMEYKRKQN